MYQFTTPFCPTPEEALAGHKKEHFFAVRFLDTGSSDNVRGVDVGRRQLCIVGAGPAGLQ